MANVVDRRRESKSDRYVSSRERLLKRHKKQVRKAVDDYLGSGKGVEQIGKENVDIPIPSDDLFEPGIMHGQGGIDRRVHPGNEEFNAGDKMPKPPGGGGGAGDGEGEPGDQEGGEGYVFQLSGDELKEMIFKDLELPNLERKSQDSDETEQHRAGYVKDGSPNRMDLVRSKTAQKMRQKASRKPIEKKIIARLEEEYDIFKKYAADSDAYPDLSEDKTYQKFMIAEKLKALTDIVGNMSEQYAKVLTDEDAGEIARLDDEIEMLDQSKSIIPKWNRATDLRFRNFDDRPVPADKAVMFCVRDTSGSINEEMMKDSTIFYWLLYNFLEEKYGEGKVEVCYIAHTTTAKEVTADEFFNDRDSGGTVVSSGMQLTKDILEARYKAADYNVYTAQCSDGDNFGNDNDLTKKLIDELLPQMQAFFYAETKSGQSWGDPNRSDLWDMYKGIEGENPGKFFMGRIKETRDVYKVFRDFFTPVGGSTEPSSDNKSSMRLEP
jgi:uncharacterized sporulation protein YeaH/YhbH (DUF444 family)